MCSAIDLIKKWKRRKRRKTGANNGTANNLSNNNNIQSNSSNNNKSQCTQLRKTCARPASSPARYQRTQLPSQMPEPLSLCSFSCFFPPSLWIFVIFGDTLQELIAKAASKNVPYSYIYCFSTVSQYFHYSA